MALSSECLTPLCPPQEAVEGAGVLAPPHQAEQQREEPQLGLDGDDGGLQDPMESAKGERGRGRQGRVGLWEGMDLMKYSAGLEDSREVCREAGSLEWSKALWVWSNPEKWVNVTQGRKESVGGYRATRGPVVCLYPCLWLRV